MTQAADDNGRTSRATDVGCGPDHGRRGADGFLPRSIQRIARKSPLDPKWDGLDLFKVEEAAAILRVSRGQAYAKTKSGELPTRRFGRLLRVTRGTLEDLLESNAGGVRMSDAFPMPKTVEMPPAARDYVPKRGLAAVAEAISADPPAYTRPPALAADYKAPRHADAIRESLKKLTHREMRELTAEIFKAANGDTIARADLPDVLDKFAYGD